MHAHTYKTYIRMHTTQTRHITHILSNTTYKPTIPTPTHKYIHTHAYKTYIRMHATQTRHITHILSNATYTPTIPTPTYNSQENHGQRIKERQPWRG